MARGSPRLDQSPVAPLPIPRLLKNLGTLQGGCRFLQTKPLAEPLLRATERAWGRLVVKLGGDAFPSDRAGRSGRIQFRIQLGLEVMELRGAGARFARTDPNCENS
jgi:hypothetical protein